jgi:hypothetical protein
LNEKTKEKNERIQLDSGEGNEKERKKDKKSRN